jgi:hypothetical protein
MSRLPKAIEQFDRIALDNHSASERRWRDPTWNAPHQIRIEFDDSMMRRSRQSIGRAVPVASKQGLQSQQQPTCSMGNVLRSEEFTKKVEDVREAELRLEQTVLKRPS